MSTPLNTILSWFQAGDFPTEQQFAESWKSFYHKEENIPVDKVENLNAELQNKADASAFETHLISENSHNTTLAKLDASNLNEENTQAWKTALGVEALPNNIALIDNLPFYGNVWSKEQSNALYMIADEFVSNGKIMASKIEALGLTELITVTETSLTAFLTNNIDYQYEKNDIIAIPDISGNYSLYIYKGGSKTTASNYIPTGLTNITIAMVQGLQTVLDAKMDKPATAGNYMARLASGTVTWRAINPSSNYLNFWNGSDFSASSLYYDGAKFGIGTTTPGEMLHLNNGRLRAKAMVFDENTETLPYQITYNNSRFYGADLTGTRRMFMYRDYDDIHTLFSGMTDLQKTQIRNDLRLAGESFSTGTPRIDVLLLPFIDNTKNFIQYTTLVGINLFVDNVTPNANVKIKRVKDVNGTNLATPEVYNVDNFTVLQNFPNNLNFGINWSNKPQGYYQVFVTHNGLTNASSPELIVKAGLTYNQFTGIANWQKASGGDASVSDTAISSGSQSTLYYSDNLISTGEVNSGFMVSFAINNNLSNWGANFVGFWRCGLIGNGDNVFYGVQYYDGAGNAQLPNTTLSVRNDTFHIAYYNGVVYVIAESNGKTYQQFNSTFNLYPKRFVFQLSGGGQGSISMQLLGKISLS
ncbi:hypothetical protein [Chryseobacterium taeanense]|uniref:hypothetical protein n=1 Tax=Chryseobacterium taeanense TaxID=311334 RepID=UPI0035B21127